MLLHETPDFFFGDTNRLIDRTFYGGKTSKVALLLQRLKIYIGICMVSQLDFCVHACACFRERDGDGENVCG